MTLRKIAIFPNSEYDREYASTGQAVRVLSENGILSILSSSAKPFFKEEHLSVQFFDDADAMMDACDAILVLGGDGTMIDYSVRAAEKNKPAIGVNLGHLGFLMALERTEIEGLSALAEDRFTVESRMLLDAQILLNGEVIHSQRILNDIVVASGVRSKIAEFSLSCTPGGKLDYRADGIIVFLLGRRSCHRPDRVHFLGHARLSAFPAQQSDPAFARKFPHRFRKHQRSSHGHSRHHGRKKFPSDPKGSGNTYQKIRIYGKNHQNRLHPLL